MKILFSLYQENYDSGEKTLYYSKAVETTMKLQEIDAIFQLYEGFHSSLEFGQTLCFWDIYSFFDNVEELKIKIDSIPSTAEQARAHTSPSVLIIEEFSPGNVDNSFYPDPQDCFACRLTRYECGASSFDAIIMFASNHPWLMVFIGGALWDLTKFLGKNLRKALKNKFGLVDDYGRQKRVACLSTKSLYRNFSKITKISINDCQIVFLNRRKNNTYTVRIRTVDNKCFIVKCNSRGKISSIKPVNIKDLPWW